MRPIKVTSGVLLGAGAAYLAWTTTERVRNPSPKYRRLWRRGRVEVREYGERVLATTSMSGLDRYAKKAAFYRLAGFIFGGNSRSQRISMTSPVEMTASSDPSGSMSFFLPKELPAEAPAPTGGEVTVTTAPPRTVAAIRWNGRTTPKQVRRWTTRLREEAHRQGWQLEGEPIIAQYDGPHVLPILRRTEILIPLRAGTSTGSIPTDQLNS